MKICPTCKKTYTDDGLNFCLDDGTALTLFSGSASEPPKTIVMQQTPSSGTDTVATFPSQTKSAQTKSAQTQQGWQNTPHYSKQPKKSSKAWLWVVGFVGIGLLLCGGGIAGLVVIALLQDPKAENSNSYFSNSDYGSNYTNSSDNRRNTQRIDLSKWVGDSSAFGTTEYTGGELRMASHLRGFYYVLVASEDYSTENARTSVSLRNISGDSTTLGYGLIFHSNPVPLTQDYAFLIDTQKKRYRVVRHEPQKEKVVVNWTETNAINTGSAVNVLVADHKGNNIELYINGRLVKSIPNIYGFAGGVAGLYTGDAVKVAFRNFEITR